MSSRLLLTFANGRHLEAREATCPKLEGNHKALPSRSKTVSLPLPLHVWLPIALSSMSGNFPLLQIGEACVLTSIPELCFKYLEL